MYLGAPGAVVSQVRSWLRKTLTFLLEYLWANKIPDSPPNKSHRHSRAFLSLTGNVSGDQRYDHVTLRKKELSAVESDKHTPRIRRCRLDNENDDCSCYCWQSPEL